MSRLLAIDPGCRDSAYVVIDTATCRPVLFGKVNNAALLDVVGSVAADRAVVEMVASYGMAVGADVFETCVAVGRFQQALFARAVPVELVMRLPVKIHHCHSAKAKDSNITQALVDRFASGQPNRGKGTKAVPGWFHGFAKDIWQAYALAVFAADVGGGGRLARV